MSEALYVVVFAALGVVAGRMLRPTVARFDAEVPARWPIPEVLTGLLFGLAAAQYGDWRLAAMLVLMAVSVALTIVDLVQYRLPNAILFPGMAASAVIIVVGELLDGDTSAIGHAAIGAVLYSALLLAVHLLNPAGMGFGDVKLALLLGAFAGWVADSRLDAVRAVLIALFIGSALGVVLGLGRVVVQRLGRSFLPDPEEGSAGPGVRHTTFPFGPPLMVGAILVALYPAALIG